MGATSFESSGTPWVTIPPGTAAGQATAVSDSAFQQRLAFIGTLVAISVIASTTPSSQMLAYSRQFLADPMAMVTKGIAWAATADGVTGTASTDQDIANRLGDLWPVLANGYGI